MTLFLTMICCGATQATRDAAFAWDDEPLAPGEAEKAGRLAQSLKRPGRVFCSPATRARQTAEALGFGPEAALAPDSALRDWDAGEWTGRTLASIGSQSPEALGAWLTDPAAAPPGGEPLLQLLDRVAAWLEARKSDRGRLLAVTHPAVLRAAMLHGLGAPADAFRRVDVEPLGRLDLSSDGKRWNIRLREG